MQMCLQLCHLEAKNGPGMCQSENFHWHMEGKRAKLEGQKSEEGEQRDVNGFFFPSDLGSKALF